MNGEKGFDPRQYEARIHGIVEHLKKEIPEDFKPEFALTLGSGLGEVVSQMQLLRDPIPYASIPNFIQTTVAGHQGNLLVGKISGVHVLGLQGRKHYYEEGPTPDEVTALREITIPVQVARLLGASVYFATNAAGGLDPKHKLNDLMAITSHLGLFFPNALQGPVVMDTERFVPQHTTYTPHLRQLLHTAATNLGIQQFLHEGIYCALTGPTYETSAESQALRALGVQAVGMSTIPEIVVANSLGMDTIGLSFISNVIAPDGENATSHEEVTGALNDIDAAQRAGRLITEFFRLYALLKVE